MDSSENILKAHDWLREFKKYKRLSNKELGSHINYSDTGVLKALKNNTLGLEQIQVIASKYDSLNNLNNKLDNFNISSNPFVEKYIEPKNIGAWLIENHEILMKKDSIYKMFVENIVKDASINSLKTMREKMELQDEKISEMTKRLKTMYDQIFYMQNQNLGNGNTIEKKELG